MLEYLIIGITLGFSAGFSPGPLTALIISESLLYGFKQGVKISMAPVFTDIPIVSLSIFLLTKVDNNIIISLISIVGGSYLIYLSKENILFKGYKDLDKPKVSSIKKGIITNFLSPNPYIFWITIGGPIFLKGWTKTHLAGIAFIGSFYVLLLSIKILIAYIAGSSKQFLKGKSYFYIIKTTGFMIFALGIWLIGKGITSII